MTASAVGYPQVRAWVKAMLGTHATVVHTMAWAVLCLLVAQRATPAALARALPADQAGRAPGPADSGAALVDGSTVRPRGRESPAHPRCPDAAAVWPGRGGGARHDPLGALESLARGIVVAGRTMPIGWAVIPYPWPKGRFRTTTVALVRRL